MKKYYVTVDADGNIYWYKDAKRTILHREDGPAIEYTDGDKFWYLNGEHHRIGGPAIEHPSGAKQWWVNGKLHREDGPAAVYADGSKLWYINNVEMTEKEFLDRTRPVEEMTIDQIEQLLGKRIKIVK